MFQYTNSKGKTYHLCTKEVELKNGLVRQIYFFALSTSDRITAPLPSDMEVHESKNGLPVLRRKKMA